MSSTQRPGLGRVSATALAFGSIAGSGILSLPSAVFAEAGSASLLVWVVAALMGLPMLVMFRDAMRLGEDALPSLVGEGLRTWVGAAMPLMFLFVVVVGLPAGCMVAGRYVVQGLGWSSGEVVVAGLLLAAALATYLAGGRVGAAVQLGGSAALIVTGLILVISGSWQATSRLDTVPHAAQLPIVLPGVLLAFWAFVGLENLTFLGRDLRDPGRDFLPVSAVALLLYGGFAVALTLTVSVRVDQGAVDPVAGLLQLASSAAVRLLVVVVAVVSMLINAGAWVRGVHNLLVSSSRAGYLPGSWCASPSRRTGVFVVLFGTTLTVLTVRPALIVDALAASSAVFVIIYSICIVSYLRLRGPNLRTVANAALLPVMAVTLIQSGSRSLYGIVVTAACLLWCRYRASSRAD